MTYAIPPLPGVEQMEAANSKAALAITVFKMIDLLLVNRQIWKPSASVPNDTATRIIDAEL
jgi:hypothetical protein